MEYKAMNPLRQLQQHGQSVWLDYIRRDLITSGELKRLVEEDGLRGITSNPTIFEKAISGSSDYDEAIREAIAADPGIEADALFEKLEVEDIQLAADVLRPVYDATGGADGFVSIEVLPKWANDTAGTIYEAARLWREVGRPNLMVKVPSTPAGIPAIEELTAAGVNVNITLMFSIAHYEAVAHAYIRGLERVSDPHAIASVASFFVSRVDTMTDRALDAVGTPEARALRGRIAIANAKLVYRRFREIFMGEPFAQLNKRGARVQRPLWASTGTKNPSYSDVLYVESLIGPDTINTMPPATLDAFRDHGHVVPTLETGVEEAEDALARLPGLGIPLDRITAQLLKDGIDAFESSFRRLVDALDKKRRVFAAGAATREEFHLGALKSSVEKRVQEWQTECLSRRIWAKDYTVWSKQPVPELTNRLGWLTLPEVMHEHVDELTAFADQVRAEGVRHVLILGMGGSSLAPEVFQTTFGNADGYPDLTVLDSTHPAAIRHVEAKLDLAHTLFVVSSKSGTTIEPLSFYRYFRHLDKHTPNAGKRFIAITDPESPLEKLAQTEGFRRVFTAPPDIGGRYSALSVFGLLPAALIGVDASLLLHRAWEMAESCAACVAATGNPGLTLGAVLAESAAAGRDKCTFIVSPSLASLPVWLEQLIAESTGKQSKGIVPIAGEPIAVPGTYGADRLFIYLHLESDPPDGLSARLDALEGAGHPVLRIPLRDRADLGKQFFRWEVAVAAAGAALGIHPFNQPDVELAKELARVAMSKKKSSAHGAPEIAANAGEPLAAAMSSWLAGAQAGSYIAIQAYLDPASETVSGLESLRQVLRDNTKLATTLGYGPRFLHSTGQLHKGGSNTGLFLQLIDEPFEDLPVPDAGYSFADLIRAQALGDFQALQQRGRRVLRVNLGHDVLKALEGVKAVLRRPAA
jgi:transaldolase/glucose-6-phosphate isomerase